MSNLRMWTLTAGPAWAKGAADGQGSMTRLPDGTYPLHQESRAVAHTSAAPLFAGHYARWCTTRMVDDAVASF